MIGIGEPDSFGSHPDVVRLYPDYREAEKDYYRRTNIFPIMHLVVIRKDVYENHPFIATSLYKAFVQAKAWAQEKLSYGGTRLGLLEDVNDLFFGVSGSLHWVWVPLPRFGGLSGSECVG